MRLYGNDLSRQRLLDRIGRLDQVGGLRRFVLQDGMEKGVEVIEIRTGAGLVVEMVPSRGLDFGRASFAGLPLTWENHNGWVAPAHHAPFDPNGFLRTAGGGLCMTCGLTTAGASGEDDGERLPLHGRIHHTPARHVAAWGEWTDEDRYVMRVRGDVAEESLFGHRLVMTREVHAELGSNTIELRDSIENRGSRPAPHMILYHCNFGWPLLQPSTRIAFPSRRVRPRESETPLTGHDGWQAPGDLEERVYYHEQNQADKDGFARVTITASEFPFPRGACPLEAVLAWDTRALPELIEWWMPGRGAHVLGIEPANCHVEGRAAERENGRLSTLAPGESRRYALRFSVRCVRGAPA